MATRSEFSMTFLNVMEKLNLAIWFAYLANFLSCLGVEVHYITLYDPCAVRVWLCVFKPDRADRGFVSFIWARVR